MWNYSLFQLEVNRYIDDVSKVWFVRRGSASPFHRDLCHSGYNVTVGHYARDTLIAVSKEIIEEPCAAIFTVLSVLRSEKDRNVFELLSGGKLSRFR